MNFKSDFPILKKKIRDNSITYLDSAATTQKPIAVINSIKDFYENSYENVHRGMNSLSIDATDQFERTRESVKEFINAKSTNEVIFTRGATDSLNIIANSITSKFEDNGEILVTELEHHSNYLPWLNICKKSNLKLKIIPVNQNGIIDEQQIIDNCNDSTKMIAITHMSNVTGQILDVKKIKNNISKDILVSLDGCQSIAHCDIDVQDLDCDFYSFSSHKLYGPSGVGILFGKENLLEEIEPVFLGGGMVTEVSLDSYSCAMLPNKFEPGTPSIEAVIGLRASLDYLKKINFYSFFEEERGLRKLLIDKLNNIPAVEIYGNSPNLNASSIVSFNIKNINYNDVATFLDQYGVMLRGGQHCCQPLMKKLNIQGSCRASFGIYNDADDVDILVESLKKTVNLLQ